MAGGEHERFPTVHEGHCAPCSLWVALALALDCLYPTCPGRFLAEGMSQADLQSFLSGHVFSGAHGPWCHGSLGFVSSTQGDQGPPGFP